MAGDTATTGEDALGGNHAAEVFGARFDAGQHHLLAGIGELLGLGGRKYELAGRGPWSCWQAR